MNISLVNLNFLTGELLASTASMLNGGPSVMITYNDSSVAFKNTEKEKDLVPFLDESDLTSVIFIAPGIRSLKYAHDLIAQKASTGAISFHIGLYLPEGWLVERMGQRSEFDREAYRIYLSSILRLGYEKMSICCSDEVTAVFFMENFLGGFMPRIVCLRDLAKEFGHVVYEPRDGM